MRKKLPNGELVDLATRLRIAFARMARAQRQDVPGGLTAVQLSALYKVELYGPLRLGDLAMREQVAGPTMTRVVDMLEASKLVTRDTDPSSARCSLITITEKGRAEIESVRRDRTDFMSCRLAKLIPEHQRAIADALPAIEALLEAVSPGDDVGRHETERARSRSSK